VADVRSRDANNTTLRKRFPSGHITIAGANSAAALAARPIRYVLLDEADRYSASVGTEGDPVSLAIKRTATFWNRKIVMVSSQVVKGASRIGAAWLQSNRVLRPDFVGLPALRLFSRNRLAMPYNLCEGHTPIIC